MSSSSESSENDGEVFHDKLSDINGTFLPTTLKSNTGTQSSVHNAQRKQKIVKDVKANLSKSNRKKQSQNGHNKKQEESFEMYSKNYKKVPCEFYKKGHCKNGDDCTYRHDIELKRLDTLCKFFLTDSCHNPKCLYLHDKSQYPCKFLNISGKCDKMAECVFSHERFKNKEQIKDFILSNIDSIRNHRDIGMMTPLIFYAIEMKFIKRTKEEENTSLSLVPSELYRDDPEESVLRSGGQIGGDFCVGLDLGMKPAPYQKLSADPDREIDHWGTTFSPQVAAPAACTTPEPARQPTQPKIKVRAVFNLNGKC